MGIGRIELLVLESAEHDFNPVAPFESALVVFDSCLELFSTENPHAYPFVFQCFSEPNGIIEVVAEFRTGR